MSLDDIWNEPIVSPAQPAPDNADSSLLKRPRQRLFFADSDSDDERPPKRPTPAPPPARPDVDALFEDIDKVDQDDDLRYKPLAPALDLAKLAKEAEVRHANARQSGPSQGSSKTGGTGVDQSGKDGGKGKPGDEGKPSRKVLPKLDEERLVGPEGFPLLIKEIEGFKPKGKGQELTDLGRLLQVYQFWTHRMYPKTAFKDTVNRVEKLCHSKRMHVRLSVWRDEFKGITKDTKSTDDPDAIDLTEVTEPTPVAIEDDGDDKDGSEQPHKPLSPMRTGMASSENGLNANIMDIDDDTSLWDALDDPQTLVDPPQSPPSSAPGGDDDEMWDVVDEIEQREQSKPAKIQIPISGVNLIPSLDHNDTRDASRATNDDDWDDMYS